MRVAYFSNGFGSLPFSPTRSARETIRAVGLNLGNLAFSSIGHRLFDDEKFLFDDESDPEDVRRDADVVVFCVANWLNSWTDLGWLAERVEVIDRPVILMGLGAQGDLDAPTPSVPEGTKAFVRACAARAPNILVRGALTAAVCRAMGVSNTIPVGCPSLLTEPTTDLGELVSRRWDRGTERLAFHTLEFYDRLAGTEQHLLSLAKRAEGAAIVVQHQQEFIDLINSGGRELTTEETEMLRWYCEYLAPTTSQQETLKWLRQHLFYFDDIDAWRRFLRNYSGSINTRIHGTVLSLSAGLPAVCLYHDSRTKELAETMLVPAMLHSDVQAEQMSAEDIMRTVRIDGPAFDASRCEKAQTYVQTLSALGLRPSAHLRGLAAA